jgi:hypothetical protein
MTEDHAGDEPNIALLCFIVYRAMEARVMEAVAAAGFDDLTAAQGRVFAPEPGTAPGSPAFPEHFCDG